MDALIRLWPDIFIPMKKKMQRITMKLKEKADKLNSTNREFPMKMNNIYIYIF